MTDGVPAQIRSDITRDELRSALAAALRTDLARLRSEGARRIRITVAAAELELLRSLATVTAPPRINGHQAEDDGRVCTFDGCGVFVGAARGYSWKR